VKPDPARVNRALVMGERIRPSQLGGATRPRLRSWPRGPSGVPIPSASATYRKHEQGLLKDIAKAAWEADLVAIRTPEAVDHATAVLLADIDRRFPPADMAVLARYGCAEAASTVGVGFSSAVDAYISPLHLAIAPRALPYRGGWFNAALDPDAPKSKDAPVPDELLPWLRRYAGHELARRPDYLDAVHWPGQLKAREKRWPRWAEIEAQFPRIGAWLARERAF